MNTEYRRKIANYIEKNYPLYLGGVIALPLCQYTWKGKRLDKMSEFEACQIIEQMWVCGS